MSSLSASAWAEAFLSAVDSGALDLLTAQLTEDVRLVAGNGPAVEGREAVLGAFRAQGVKARSAHAIRGVWTGTDGAFDVISVEAAVSYTFTDGRVVAALPVTSTLRRRGERVADYRIFMDATPAFGSTQEA